MNDTALQQIDWHSVPREIACSRPDWFAAWITRDDPSALQYQVFEHIAYIANIVTKAIRKGKGRLIINLPPQHGKSWFLCRWLIVWILEHWPENRVISTSYSRDLIMGHSGFVRDQFVNRPELNTRLKADSKAVGRWYTHTGLGGLYSTTIGGAISGFSMDVGLIDDPYKGWEDAWSTKVRKKVRNWFDAEFYTRKQENTTMIVLHTRWHPNDLSGYLLNEHPDDWQLIRLPALAEKGDPMRRMVNTPLCPHLKSYESLISSKKSKAIWEAVFQQDPKGLSDGNLYKNFSPIRNVSDKVSLNYDLPLHISIDFNKNPGQHALIGQYDEQADMITTIDELYGDRWDTIQIMRDFTDRWWKQHCKHNAFPEIHIFGDSSGNSESEYTSDTGYKVMRKHLATLGVQVLKRVPKKAPDLIGSIMEVNDALHDIDEDVHWLIHPRCQKLIRDLSEVMPNEHGKPDKDTDLTLTHASDAERYRVHRIRPMKVQMTGGKVNV
ncbi:MAG: terminase large subunit domain-containing protein [Phycisphaeraceae bacterium JB051]